MNEQMTEYAALPDQQAKALITNYMSKVYLWMAMAMMTTAGVAIYAASTPSVMAWTLENRWIPVIATFAILLVLIFARRALPPSVLAVLFIAFSAAEGMLFGPLLLVYSLPSLGVTFASTAGMFGAMSLYGLLTKHDLSTAGRTAYMIFIGLLIAMIANWFVGSSMLGYAISGVGVLVFAIFTAYDTQKLIQEGLIITDETERAKGAIDGALSLYLDFLNMFLFLLRFLGSED